AAPRQPPQNLPEGDDPSRPQRGSRGDFRGFCWKWTRKRGPGNLSAMALRPAPEKADSQRLEDARGVTFLGDDGALLAGVRAGNTLAMAALYDRYVGDVRRILLHTLGPRLDLADLVQDVFINVLTSLRSLRDLAA